MTFLTFMVGLALGTIFHEAGHWVVATSLGVPIREVSIGIGPSILRRNLGGTTIDLRLYPLEGFVVPFMPVAPTRFVLIAVSLGGVLGNIVVVAIVAAIASVPSARIMEAVGPGIVWAQIFSIAGALLPWVIGGTATDGLRIIIALIWGPAAFVDAAARAYAASLIPYARACGLPRFSRHAPSVMKEIAGLSALGSRRDAARSLLRCLKLDDLSTPEKIFVIDKLVTQELLYRDLDLGPQLDELTQLALKLAPQIETLRGSRGAALVELDRDAEGKLLLAPLAAAPTSFDAILSQAFLARAEHKLGNRREGRRLLDLARAGSEAYPSDAASRCIARSEEVLGTAIDR